MTPAPKKKKKKSTAGLRSVPKTILSVSDLASAFPPDDSIVISGAGTPSGADISVEIVFDAGGTLFGSGTVDRNGLWTTDEIDLAGNSGAATVTATATAGTFPDLSAVAIMHISIAAFRRRHKGEHKKKTAAKRG